MLALLPLLCVCAGPPGPTLMPPPPPVPAACDAQTCSGCCSSGVCIRSPTKALCGSGGIACAACGEGEICSVVGTCEALAPGHEIEANACQMTVQQLHVTPARPLTAAWAGATTAWAVGPEGALVLNQGTLVVPAADGRIGVGLRAVWAADDSSAVWFVRGGVDSALHREGAGLATDAPSPTGAELFAIWGRGIDDVYVGGDDGRIARFDGERWSDVGPGDGARVLAIASGFALTDSALLIEQNGRFVKASQAPATLAGGLHVSGARDAWVTGVDGRLHRWLDGSWSAIDIDASPLGGVWGVGTGRLFLPLPAGGMRMFDGHEVTSLPLYDRLLAMGGGTTPRGLAVGDGVAALARCARADELVSSQTPTNGGMPGQSAEREQICYTICTSWGGAYGCLSTATTCR